MSNGYNVVDLFSGAGGLTEGFVQAGFNVIAHVEKDKYAADTLKTRMLYHSLKENDLLPIYYEYMLRYGEPDAKKRFYSRCSENEIGQPHIICEEIDSQNRANMATTIDSWIPKGGAIDVIIGGPPCQAYSMMRRWDQIKKDYSDPKGFLYQHYLYFLEHFKPRVFIFENVPGLNSFDKGKRFDTIREGFRKAGYETNWAELNAADFGVLQTRKRILIIGWRYPDVKPYPEFTKKPSDATITDLLLDDLPPLQAGEGKITQEYRERPNTYLQMSGIRDNNQKILLHHISRPNTDQDREIYRIAIKALNDGKRLKYTDLPEKLQSHSNKHSFLDRFKVVNPLGYSHSVVSHLSKDGHYFIHPDILQARSITVREAARIQSFPDDYIFEGPRTSQFVQIGNAVPPLMSKIIAKSINSLLDETE